MNMTNFPTSQYHGMFPIPGGLRTGCWYWWNIPIGCVQGSVLGPRIFNLYTSKVPKCFSKDATVVSYADDTYVIVSGDTE